MTPQEAFVLIMELLRRAPVSKLEALGADQAVKIIEEALAKKGK